MHCHNGVWTYDNGVKSAYSPEELVQIRKDLLAEKRELERKIERLMASKDNRQQLAVMEG